jgi:hypothetical protein
MRNIIVKLAAIAVLLAMTGCAPVDSTWSSQCPIFPIQAKV